MKHFYPVFFFILFVNMISAQQVEEVNFPQDFFGIYKGSLHINSEKGTRDISMEFHMMPTDSLGKYSYILVYGDGDDRQERKYNLIEKDKEKGTYVVDENNGIILDDKVIENRMYAIFEVNNSLLTSFITFEQDRMYFEIVFSNMENKKISHTQDEQKTEVISYPVSTVQRAVLFKQ